MMVDLHRATIAAMTRHCTTVMCWQLDQRQMNSSSHNGKRVSH